MVQPIYTYEVADLRTGVRLGDLPLTGVRYSKRLNDSGSLTGQFQIESRNAVKRQVEDAYDWTTPAKRSLTVYRDERPVWGGIIWTSNYSSKQGTVSVGAGDYWSYFDHRMVLPVLALTPRTGENHKAPSLDYIATRLTTYTAVDQNLLARNLVALAQAHTGGSLGIVMDASLSGITRDRVYEGHQLIVVGEALRQLAGVLDGPDMLFDVTGADAQGRPIRSLLQGDPYLGTQGSTHVFEYGANLIDYGWPRDGTSMATRQLATGDGMAEGAPITVSEDTVAYTAAGGGWPLLEGEQQFTGVLEESTLQDHADGQQAARRRPVVLPRIVVRGDMSPTVGEWQIGDDATAVISDDWFLHGVEAPVRIIGADVSPGGTEDGTELVELTVSPLLDDLVMGV
jgi:hypothetical protein